MSVPNSNYLAIFRADFSPIIGGGHVMRCLSIAHAFKKVGWKIVFASRSESVRDLAKLAGLHPHFIFLEGYDDAAELMSKFKSGCALLVIDHYGLDVAFEKACQSWAERILVISDQPNKQHDCNLLLDPTPGRVTAEYNSLVPAHCGVLAGARYAPIRPEFVRPYSRLPSQGIKNVLVTMGATDPDNITGSVLDELAELEIEIDVVLTSQAPYLNDIRAKKIGRLHVDVDAAKLANLMQMADIAIGACGSSAWERCAMGLPSLLIEIADNQGEVARGLRLAQAAKILGRPENILNGTIADKIRTLRNNELDNMALSAHKLCDGRGVSRIITLVAKREGAIGRAVALRPVSPADCQTVYKWQIHPEIRRFAHRSAPPSGSEHESWFADRLANPEEQYFIVELEGVPAGVLRIEPYAGDDGDWLISILIAPINQRKGVGRATLILAHQLWPESTFVAEVLPENIASHKLFVSVGYKQDGSRYILRSVGGTL